LFFVCQAKKHVFAKNGALCHLPTPSIGGWCLANGKTILHFATGKQNWQMANGKVKTPCFVNLRHYRKRRFDT